ncbi:MFS transporter [Tabrizicola sp. KVB23]|uniref:MFS transporter n=1 Tax=Fuscibacter oryzae TaxID=2803939 RepID=A0A8J7ST02_9RHOB|nr:MFS transporter [Fuscibacter oryzae]
MQAWVFPGLLLGRRAALSGCFLAAGLGIGTWGANLPALGRRASMSEGDIGIVLLCFAAGAVLAMTNAARVMMRFGAGRSAATAAALFGLGIIAVTQAADMVSAALIAVLLGISFGALDVTMNSEAASLERHAARPVMASLHAIFSLGTLASSMSYAAIVAAGGRDVLCLVLAGTAIVAIALLSWRGLPPEGSPGKSGADAKITGTSVALARVLLLGGIAFLAFFAEGAILDWIAIYVVRVVGAGESAGAMVYAVFACAMTFGRLIGDRAKMRLGALRLFRIGTLMVAFGFTLILLLPVLPVILIAIIFCGLGVANLIPLIFSEAGRFGAGDGGKAMSRVMTMGYAGILIGPALIGFVAEFASLPAGLWLVVLALMVTMSGGRLLRGAG